MKYTKKELDQAAIADLISDAKCAERQAVEGPFYPERGITAETLKAYAVKCRSWVALHSAGGAHKAVLNGKDFAQYEPCSF
jgi:hypothetical protein